MPYCITIVVWLLKILVYMPSNYFNVGTYKKLTWKQRRDILGGICDGLKYLEKFKSKVKMHIELKVDKILLHEDKKTGNLIPKISECVFWGQHEDDAPTWFIYFVPLFI